MHEELANEEITVVLAADNNYAMPLATTICSVVTNISPDKILNIYVLDGGISQKNKRKIINSFDVSKCSIFFIETKGQMKDAIIPKQFTESILHRLLIPQLLPNQVSKAIYIDSDLLVLSDISKLWDIEIDEYLILAAQDYIIPYICAGIRNYQEIGIPSDHKYFNSGVLVLNIDKWRRESVANKVIDYLMLPRDYVIFGDQEALNAVLWDRWKELDPRWNQQVILTEFLEDSSILDSLVERLGEENYIKVVNNPFIRHFISTLKPWLYINHPDKKLFYKYVDMTKWKGWRYTRIKIWSQKFTRKLKKILGFADKSR